MEDAFRRAMADTATSHPIVLVATDSEWTGRSLESVLDLNGYTAVRCSGGRRALQLARRNGPDAVILDESLAEMGGLDVCRALRDDPSFNPATPIVITADSPVANARSMAAYAAGAWEYCTHPIDMQALLLKLGTFLRGKQNAEGLQSTGLNEVRSAQL